MSDFIQLIGYLKSHIAERVAYESLNSKVYYDEGETTCLAYIANQNTGTNDEAPKTKEIWQRILKNVEGYKIMMNTNKPPREFTTFGIKSVPDCYIEFRKGVTIKHRLGMFEVMGKSSVMLILMLIMVIIYCTVKILPLLLIESKLHGRFV